MWEAVTVWRRVEELEQLQGCGLVGKIRFPLIVEGYLLCLVVGMAPAEEAKWMEYVVVDALLAKAALADC